MNFNPNLGPLNRNLPYNFNSNLSPLNRNLSYNAPFNPYPSNNHAKLQFTSPQLNSFSPFDNFAFQPLQRSESATHQNALIPIMIKLQNEMSQLINSIEIEKRNIPPNISLIQFYNNLHGHKIQQFKRNIPWLPVNTPNNIIHQHQNINHHSPLIQTLTFQDFWKQKQQQHSQFAITIPPSKVPPNNDTNNNNTNDNSSPASIPSNHSCDINSNFIKTQSMSLQTLSNTTPTPSYDLDTLKRSYSKTSLPPMSQSSIGGYMSSSLQETPIPHIISTVSSSIPETPTPNNIKTYPIADNEPFVIIKHENECKSIKQCQCIQNIIRALLFYQKYQNIETDVNDKDIHEFFMNKYTNICLLNDYHHILGTHLDCDTSNNNKQFELINKEFSKYIYCDINNCQQYQRNERNREEKSNDINNGYFLDECSETAIFTDFLDTIHCYFLHSFDTAYRIKNKDQIKHHIKDNNDEKRQINENDDDEIDPYNCHDFKVENLKKYQDKKRQNIPTLPRIKHHKFCTDQHENEEILEKEKAKDDDATSISFTDTESIVSLASLASIASTVNSYTSSSLSENFRPRADTYSFGNRFYYWKYYIDKNDKDPWNPGCIFSQWHITPKFGSLKEEILYNHIRRLDIQKYNIALIKAKKLIATNTFKGMKCDTKFFEERYKIARNDCISLQHVMCLIFYTDFNALCYQFSKTFRKKYPTESFASLKNRNSNYANWSRLLRESIECFGQKMKNTSIKIFYHGVSHMVLNSLVCRFCGPTSTTPQVEVATIFSKKQGIILELEKYSDNLRYFNCSLVSCYGNEDERLFFGGFHELNIRSVREIKQNLNYHNFIRALSIFNQAIDGRRHIRISKVKKRDYSIIKKLIKHQLVSISVIDGIDDEVYCNNFPDYINSCFNSLVQTKKKIKINLHWLNRAYRGFAEVFLDDEIKNLVLFDVIGSIFYSCTDLIVSMDQFDAKRNITKQYLIHLAQVLKRLNNIFHSRLRKIKIEGVKVRFTKQELLQQQFVLNGENWKLEVQKNSGQASSNLLLTNLMKKSYSFNR